jgi:hypothetical protein
VDVADGDEGHDEVRDGDEPPDDRHRGRDRGSSDTMVVFGRWWAVSI